MSLALKYASQGLQLVPLNGKTPLISDWPNRASSDPEVVSSWSNMFPGCNWGMVLPSDWLVIDIDTKAGGAGSLSSILEELNLEHDTRSVVTGGMNGQGERGMHYFYRTAEGFNLQSKDALGIPGVEVFSGSQGARQLVLPGSVHPSTGLVYEWLKETAPKELPKRLADLLDGGRGKRPYRPSWRSKGALKGSEKVQEVITPAVPVEAPGLLAQIAKELEADSAELAYCTPEGSRNEVANKLAFTYGRKAAAGLIDKEAVRSSLEAAYAVADPSANAAKVVASGLSAGLKEPWHLGEELNMFAPSAPGAVVPAEGCSAKRGSLTQGIGATEGLEEGSSEASSEEASPRVARQSTVIGRFSAQPPKHRLSEAVPTSEALDVEEAKKRYRGVVEAVLTGKKNSTVRTVLNALADRSTGVASDGATGLQGEVFSRTLVTELSMSRHRIDRAFKTAESVGLLTYETSHHNDKPTTFQLHRSTPSVAEGELVLPEGFVPNSEQEEALSLLHSFIEEKVKPRSGSGEGKFHSPTPPTFLLQGPAGSGKTTLVAALATTLGLSYTTAAFTNAAVQVLASKGLPSKTIHSLFLAPGEEGWSASPEKCSTTYQSYDLVIVDESSMVSPEMYDAILQGAKAVVFVGDPGQLPPVSKEGKCFWEGREPDYLLKSSVRFDGASDIGVLAEKLWCSDDATVAELDIPHLDSVELSDWDTAVCYTNKTRWTLNRMFMGTEQRPPSAGDPIMFRANVPSEGLFNRQMLVCKENLGVSVIKGYEVYTLKLENAEGRIFEKKVLRSGFLNEEGEAEAVEVEKVLIGKGCYAVAATFGFAHTAHSAQGIEWNRVLVVDESFKPARFDPYGASRFLYTAVTRAREEVGIVTLADVLPLAS